MNEQDIDTLLNTPMTCRGQINKTLVQVYPCLKDEQVINMLIARSVDNPTGLSQEEAVTDDDHSTWRIGMTPTTFTFIKEIDEVKHLSSTIFTIPDGKNSGLINTLNGFLDVINPQSVSLVNQLEAKGLYNLSTFFNDHMDDAEYAREKLRVLLKDPRVIDCVSDINKAAKTMREPDNNGDVTTIIIATLFLDNKVERLLKILDQLLGVCDICGISSVFTIAPNRQNGNLEHHTDPDKTVMVVCQGCAEPDKE